MHFEYKPVLVESNAAAGVHGVAATTIGIDATIEAARNRGGGVVPGTGRNGLVVGPTSTAPLGSTDHQNQMRMLVLRERLRRALYN